MADGTSNTSPVKGHNGLNFVLPEVVLDSAAQVYTGDTLYRDPADSGYAKSLAAGAMFNPIGVCQAKQLGDGTAWVHNDAGIYERENSAGDDAIPSTLPFGWPLYSADNRAAALTDGGGVRPFLGVFAGMSPGGKPLVCIGYDPYNLGEITIPVALGHADLTAAATTQDVTLYTTPGPCVVLGPGAVRSLTVWSGGTVSAATLAIGVDSDPDAILDEIDIFTGAAAAPKVGVAGVLGFAGAPLSTGAVIKARIAATGDNVVNFSAGALVAGIRIKPGSR